MSDESMSYRSSDRVASPANHDLLRGSQARSSRDDSLVRAVAAGGRVSAGRSAAVRQSMTDNDRSVIESVARLKIVSGGQLQRLHFGSGPNETRRAGRCLKRLTEKRVLARLPRSVGGIRAGSSGFIYQLDLIGQAIMRPGSTRRPWQVGMAFVNHGLMVAECYVRLVEASRRTGNGVTSFAVESDAWMEYQGASGPTVLRPDAEARITIGPYEDRWWIEADRGTEGPGRIRTKLVRYTEAYELGATGPIFPKVIWVCENELRARQIRQIVQNTEHGSHLFAVSTLEKFAGAVMAGPEAQDAGSQES